MGIGIGILSTTCPMYIAETSPAEKRGKLITFYQLMITIGIFSAYIVRIITEFFLRNDRNVQWRVILGIQVVPGFLLLVNIIMTIMNIYIYIYNKMNIFSIKKYIVKCMNKIKKKKKKKKIIKIIIYMYIYRS